MDSRLTRWCRGFIEAGWLAAVIAAPLFFNIHSERVFEPDKLTIVRSIALLMSAAWLVQFVDQFTKANDGKAFYSSLEGLGSFIFLDYKQNKRKFKR